MIKDVDLTKTLLHQGLITETQINLAKSESFKKNISLEKALLNLRFLHEKDLARVKAELFNIPYMDLTDFIVEADILILISEETAKENKLVPLYKTDKAITISMADPSNSSIIEKLTKETKHKIETVLSSETDIMKTIENNYKNAKSDNCNTDQIEVQSSSDISGSKTPDIEDIEDISVVKAVNMIIIQAIKESASDIHIEPAQNVLRVRYRIDGVLQEGMQLPDRLKPLVVSRIKVLSGLNIAEKRIAQDGHIDFNYNNQQYNLRVSTFPIVLGEKIVMRILHKSEIMIGVEELGFTPEMLENFDILIKEPYGLFLVSGPTGSGKTTTLYAALQRINTVHRNIITVEDPVEYQMNLLNQSQVNPKAGWTFAKGLRSILRQDPDVIMVGEIRDPETANIAIQSALTGHLVFSTIHTNDAPSTVTRLIDMGIEPFLISASLMGSLAQRLVRVICKYCKKEYTPNIELLKHLNLHDQNHTFYRGKGCEKCSYTGYKGRIGIFEMLVTNEEIRSLILSKASPSKIAEAGRKNGMISLKEAGIYLVLEGKTTVEELIRVTKIRE